MTELLNRAMAAAQGLSAERQDEIAHMVLAFALDGSPLHQFTPEEAAAEDAADVEEAGGAYATDDELRTIWAKYDQ